MNLIWFRNDLRVQANPALAAAHENGLATTAFVTLTPKTWSEHCESPARMGLWHDRLLEVKRELEDLNVPLKILMVESFDDCPAAIGELAEQLGATNLLFNYEYPLNEVNRDQAVCDALMSSVHCVGFHGEVIIPPGEVKTQTGTDFKVYTPFSRAWRQRLVKFDYPIRPIKSPFPANSITSDEVPSDLGWQSLSYNRELWPVTSDAIREQVYQFIREREADYKEKRDFPAVNGTSKLSPYLTIGAVSPLQLLHVQRSEYSHDGWLNSSWLNELIWREFYRHLMVAFPGLSRLEPFRPETEARIQWLDRESAWQAWCQGETGFPIVDAAMKQLLATGWMHNRLRMVVASFLTKLVGIDWRRGEEFFMSKLIDADFASNNGGWQWSASVGADAAPYFRIFNPIAQSEKFDAHGDFLVKWLPELEMVPVKERHKPGAGQFYGRPAPIIDYTKERKRALDAYKEG
ncbi:deoxyribodipyrimidine photo-lyase [Marinobacterium sp. LSUCC0821]|uniref:cryptochrome/photolyase family protein n=1 Tax=Marinobacterium sp. LSUCC0821 TaxID=2668067 RepID=UPI00145249A2|nr:FAD-binding domain-containing protein [Marinobacterium sp. LSUCC0821]QJD71305.1 deoxyribodipyrimidine photo-lyase [Marinobacterium sp. LSUCC0821]